MPTSNPTPERPIDKAVVLACGAALAVLFVFLLWVVEGGWMNLVRNLGGMAAPFVVYLGLTAAILVVPARGGGKTMRWWLLLLLPVCGAVAGAVAHLTDPEPPHLGPAIVMGAAYGALHAFWLRRIWQREARRASPLRSNDR